MKNMMKRAGLNLLLVPLLTLFTLVITTTVQADIAGSESLHTAPDKSSHADRVHYDKANDQLTVVADSASLKWLLGRIAQQSGIEVLFDDQAEDTVSIDIQSESLESGLKHMLKGRNHSMRYSRNQQQKLLLVGVMVLPAGQQDNGRAKRLLAMDDEAFYRARSQLSLQQVQQMDMANERWQVRLGELPPGYREQLEQKVTTRLRSQALRNQANAERRKEHEQKSAERKARQLKAQEKMLEGLGPEQRAAYEQRRKESREQVKSILFDGQN